MKDWLRKLGCLTARNVKLYFKDKMTFFVSLITPLILLVLFVTFLKSTYEDNILAAAAGYPLDGRIVDAFTGGWLFSSVLATSCITVAFCSGIAVLDKINGTDVDFAVAPVGKTTLQVAYVLANLLSTLIVCLVLFAVGLIYLACVGFFLGPADIVLIVADIVVTSLFGTLIANIVWLFTRSQGVVSGVCTLMSAMYGFICGAYMPIYTMGSAMRHVTAFLPGTYSTVLFRQLFLRGALDEMRETLPAEAVDAISKNFDCEISFFGTDVPTGAMFLIVLASAAVAFAALVVLARIKARKKPGRA